MDIKVNCVCVERCNFLTALHSSEFARKKCVIETETEELNTRNLLCNYVLSPSHLYNSYQSNTLNSIPGIYGWI